MTCKLRHKCMFYEKMQTYNMNIKTDLTINIWRFWKYYILLTKMFNCESLLLVEKKIVTFNIVWNELKWSGTGIGNLESVKMTPAMWTRLNRHLPLIDHKQIIRHGKEVFNCMSEISCISNITFLTFLHSKRNKIGLRNCCKMLKYVLQWNFIK